MNEIGIKLADGSFYPILEDAVRSRNIELTTVRDSQETVQIDLFRNAETLEYIGSLIVEDIALKKAGDATINLKISVDDDDNLNAEVVDADSGAKQALKVSLATVGTNADFSDFNLKDFELSQKDNFTSATSENIITETKTTTSYEKYNNDEKKGFPKWLAVFLILLGIGLLVLAVLLFTRSCSKPTTKETGKIKSGIVSDESTSKVPIPAVDDLTDASSDNQVATSPSSETDSDTNDASDTDKSGEADSISDSDNTSDSDSEVATGSTNDSASSENKDVTNKSGGSDKTNDKAGTNGTTGTDFTAPASNDTSVTSGNKDNASSSKSGERLSTNADGSVRYLIKWGDTLWDLAETFYKDPWDFRIIAEYNKIKNPSLIVAGTYIDIPAKR